MKPVFVKIRIFSFEIVETVRITNIEYVIVVINPVLNFAFLEKFKFFQRLICNDDILTVWH